MTKPVGGGRVFCWFDGSNGKVCTMMMCVVVSRKVHPREVRTIAASRVGVNNVIVIISNELMFSGHRSRFHGGATCE